MADPFRQLDAHAARLDRLADLGSRSAPAIAVQLEGEILGNVRKGVDPDGKAWAPTQDGHVPLQGAGAELAVVPLKSSVVARLTGVHARHHLGAVRGGIARRILPVASLPASMARAITAALTTEFTKTMEVE